MLSAEDGTADTIVPRLKAAGADLDNVKIIAPTVKTNDKGRRMFNFAEATRLALEAGAAVQAGDAAEAIRMALRLLSDSNEKEKMGAAGRALCEAHRGATQKHLDYCAELLGRG